LLAAVRSSAATVAEYIGDALTLLRRLCREELVGFEEAMRYGMPSYVRDDAVGVAFAIQQAYISLDILRQPALDAAANRLAGLSVGKGCIRFRRREQIDPATVRALLAATVTDSGAIC
jgi:uncharacterized protein YdhG (YjbR/CyaY superfamily)